MWRRVLLEGLLSPHTNTVLGGSSGSSPAFGLSCIIWRRSMELNSGEAASLSRSTGLRSPRTFSRSCVLTSDSSVAFMICSIISSFFLTSSALPCSSENTQSPESASY
ncbi:unnamed protein product [Chondrus crispus]|uniref:Uncharacterized protein n=1 Tax=Chondrus crispus TaxID=2769 RepID=R7Q9K0_CHOCR|nr:unnamed protein product [Chondrus crispus]CDF34046.1 unnamed protein product [Chondrus crispus]|eukprot:XP_005713865.1 unnamed protein product [Chondrus crispus]